MSKSAVPVLPAAGAWEDASFAEPQPARARSVPEPTSSRNVLRLMDWVM